MATPWVGHVNTLGRACQNWKDSPLPPSLRAQTRNLPNWALFTIRKSFQAICRFSASERPFLYQRYAVSLKRTVGHSLNLSVSVIPKSHLCYPIFSNQVGLFLSQSTLQMRYECRFFETFSCTIRRGKASERGAFTRFLGLLEESFETIFVFSKGRHFGNRWFADIVSHCLVAF